MISRYSPRNAYLEPSGCVATKRHFPPGLTSILSTVVVSLRGPHHCEMSFGSVIALYTTSRGASNSRATWISRSEGRVTLVVALLVVATFGVPLFFLVAKDLVESIESFLLDAAITLEPHVELLERLRPKAVDALLRDRPDFDESGVAEDAEVLGDLRLPEAEPRDDLSDRAGLTAQQLDDLEPVRFRQGAQRGLHEPYIPLQAYACKGILSALEADFGRVFGGSLTPEHPFHIVRRSCERLFD